MVRPMTAYTTAHSAARATSATGRSTSTPTPPPRPSFLTAGSTPRTQRREGDGRRGPLDQPPPPAAPPVLPQGRQQPRRHRQDDTRAEHDGGAGEPLGHHRRIPGGRGPTGDPVGDG